MANEKYKPQVPDIMEAIFDAGYLIFDLIAVFCSSHFQRAILCSSYTAY